MSKKAKKAITNGRPAKLVFKKEVRDKNTYLVFGIQTDKGFEEFDVYYDMVDLMCQSNIEIPVMLTQDPFVVKQVK